MPGWDSEWRELNTAHRKSMGTNGREVPVLVSQMSVVGEAKCGTVVNCRDEEDEV